MPFDQGKVRKLGTSSRQAAPPAQKGADYTEAFEGVTPLEYAISNHIESFNAMMKMEGLLRLVEGISLLEIDYPDNDPPLTIFIKLIRLDVKNPMNHHRGKVTQPIECIPQIVYPSDCRLGRFTYAGMLWGSFELRLSNSSRTVSCDVDLGRIPVMVRSDMCNLKGLTPKELVKRHEDSTEVGGYFIINGNERVIRMLVMPRSNYPMVLNRGAYKNRGALYTPHATLMRCMRPDGSTQTNTLHYLSDGSCTLRFSHSKNEWLIPLVDIAYSLYPLNDQLLLDMLCGGGSGEGGNTYVRERARVMLQQHQQQKHVKSKIYNQKEARRYLGSKFRVVLGSAVPRRYTDEECGAYMMQRFILVHTEDPWHKLQTLCFMYQKLMGLVREQLEPENQDTMSFHEILLPGQLYGIVLKESLEVMMLRIRMFILKWITRDQRGKAKHRVEELIASNTLLIRAVQHSAEVEKRMESFIATGNITSRSGLDLMQKSGFTIVADKLNAARFSSHFAAVHRGQYFMEMKTTTVRKLLPETFGFLCPVHTPDGAPCGLLNHMASSARVVTRRVPDDDAERVLEILGSLGARLWRGSHNESPCPSESQAWILLDGCPIGRVEFHKLEIVAQQLRALKQNKDKHGCEHMEVVCITREWKHLFPGLFIFLGPSRLIRPVRNLDTGNVEWIGPLEQLFLNIGVLNSEVEQANSPSADDKYIPEQLPVKYTHQELQPTDMLSVLASLTPFSNHNQSPRNMYQCQMLKQTMGTPYHNHPYRMDNKVYMVQFPQKPIVRTGMYNFADFDSHPAGINAVVAVITYTGYDMEDAMIINKASYDRGFAHGTVFKNKIFEAGLRRLTQEEKDGCRFTNLSKEGARIVDKVDPHTSELAMGDDGVLKVGVRVKKGDALCVAVDHKGDSTVHVHHDDETAYVEQVTHIDGRALTGVPNPTGCAKVIIKLRFTRNPVVGDKFSSRHGQKGVMSILWPQEDMPFTESGITPDILFNPHGFPSRMTIGMLIESFAAKAAAAEGKTQVDATTFREYHGIFSSEANNEDDPFRTAVGRRRRRIDYDCGGGEEGEGGAPPALGGGSSTQAGGGAAEYFGSTLVKHGFQRLGTERLFSGIHGSEIETEIFTGIVYYQRLRHMVMEKAQVRMRGPVDRLTNQPVKGRQRAGGIRFGEMERDSLLAHGTAFLLHDRLMRSSDFDIGYVCPLCGSVLTPQANAQKVTKVTASDRPQQGVPWECPPCSNTTGHPVRCHRMPIPWVFRYLAVEMAAMNVRMQIRVADRARQASLSSAHSDDKVSRLRPGHSARTR